VGYPIDDAKQDVDRRRGRDRDAERYIAGGYLASCMSGLERKLVPGGIAASLIPAAG
jgi:hypothetical protein